jgi:protoporphyrinogen/coproporphyrinogen III oxidase
MNIVRNVMSVTTEPLYGGWQGLLTLLKEPFVESRDSSIEDESVGSFLSRRFGPAMADNIASAGMHGIYAGDIYQLSARALLTLPYALELQPAKVLSSFVRLTSNGSTTPKRDHEFMLASQLKSLPDVAGISVYTLKKGLGQLVEAIVKYLQHAENVTIITSCDTPKIKFTPGTEDVHVSLRLKKPEVSPIANEMNSSPSQSRAT